jgi:phosphate:Na+ symporter
LHGIQPVTVHLDNSLLSTPDLALKLARAEIREIVKMTVEMMKNIIVPFTDPSRKQDVVYPQISLLKGLKLREEKVDFLDEKVSGYLYQLSRESLSVRQVHEIYTLIYIARDLEAIADIIDKTLVPLAVKKLSLPHDFSTAGKQELSAYHLKAIKQLSRSMGAIKSLDREQAKKILQKGAKYFGLGDEFRRTHFDRVRKSVSESIATDEVHVELMIQLEKINSHTASIARAIMEPGDAV